MKTPKAKREDDTGDSAARIEAFGSSDNATLGCRREIECSFSLELGKLANEAVAFSGLYSGIAKSEVVRIILRWLQPI